MRCHSAQAPQSSYVLLSFGTGFETPLAQDLDSLDVVELVMALEEELGVKISDKEAEKIKTVEDIVRLLRRRVDLTKSRQR
jgi:hypothetical protein